MTYREGYKGCYGACGLHVNVLFRGTPCFHSAGVRVGFQPHRTEDCTVERLEVLVFVEQGAMGCVLWEHGCYTMHLVELDLECAPTAVDTAGSKSAGYQMRCVKGENGQEEMGFYAKVPTVIDPTQSKIRFCGAERAFDLS